MSASMVPVVKVTECHQGTGAGPRQLFRIRQVRRRQGRLHSAHPTGTARRAAPLHRRPTAARRPAERAEVPRARAGPASCRRASAPGGAGTRRRRSPAAARRRSRASGSGGTVRTKIVVLRLRGREGAEVVAADDRLGARVEHRPVERRRPVVGAQGPQRIAQRRASARGRRRRARGRCGARGTPAAPPRRPSPRRRAAARRSAPAPLRRPAGRCRRCSSRPAPRRARRRPCAPRRASADQPG